VDISRYGVIRLPRYIIIIYAVPLSRDVRRILSLLICGTTSAAAAAAAEWFYMENAALCRHEQWHLARTSMQRSFFCFFICLNSVFFVSRLDKDNGRCQPLRHTASPQPTWPNPRKRTADIIHCINITLTYYVIIIYSYKQRALQPYRAVNRQPLITRVLFKLWFFTFSSIVKSL